MTLNAIFNLKNILYFKYVIFIFLFITNHTHAQSKIKPIIDATFEENPETFTTIESALNRSITLGDLRGNGSAVFIGVNNDNTGVGITAAHVLRSVNKFAENPNLLQLVDGIPRSKEYPESPLDLKAKSFGRFFFDPVNSRNRLIVPIYIPKMDFSETDDRYVNDFGLVLIGQPIEPDKRRTVTEYLTNPENINPSPQLKSLKMGTPKTGETVILIGGQEFFNQERALKAFNEMNKDELIKALPKFKEAYSVSNISDYDKGWSIFFKNMKDAPYDSSVDFFIEGEAANLGMSGGGVYNQAGELLGIITHIYTDEDSGEILNARVLRIDYILKSIIDSTKSEVVINNLVDLNLVNSCQAYLR